MHDSTKTDIIAAANYEKMYDDSAKRVFANKEVVIPILERVVPEFSGLSQEEIFNCFISGPEFREINVSDIPDDLRIHMAITHLSNRLDMIRLEMLTRNQTPLLKSKVLFAYALMGKSRDDMLTFLRKMASGRKDPAFYEECFHTLVAMPQAEFFFEVKKLLDDYSATVAEYRTPELRNVSVPLDSRLMKLEPSRDICAPYVISISDPFQKGKRFEVPLNTSRHSLHKIRCNQMAGTVVYTIRDGVLRIGWSYKKRIQQPQTAKAVGVDVGIIDTLHTSENKAVGSMKEIIDFYHKEVETSFAELSALRNKKRSIRHYLRTHSLPKDVRRSLIQKMDRLDHMMQKMETPYRKKRHYYAMLEQEVKTAVNFYIKGISTDTLTVMEKLDIREFKRSRKVNGMFSVFARGKIQETLIRELNWKGYDFLEVAPDFTSQICPVCSHLDAGNRNGKQFRCLCCGYEADADYVGAKNIEKRASDKEVLSACEKYKHQHKKMQDALRVVYLSRNERYKKQNHEKTSDSIAGGR